MAELMNVSARRAGELIMNNRFRIPSFQRGYAWKRGEVTDLWNDLSESAGKGSYFLGLVILTSKDGKMEVIDGQQRLVTLTLLAKAISNKARRLKYDDIAESIESTFLRSMNFSTRVMEPHISFVDTDDNYTFRLILDGEPGVGADSPFGSISPTMMASFKNLSRRLDEYIDNDKPHLLGELADFITNRLNFAVFTHSDDVSAYRIFEVVNTRGRGLTAADLLKNFVLSEANGEDEKSRMYEDWDLLYKEFSAKQSDQNFELFIKHVMNVKYGHIPKKDLYAVLSSKKGGDQSPETAGKIVDMLMSRRELYHQIETPSPDGPISGRSLEIFSAFNSLSLKSVRPILMALCDMEDRNRAIEGMEQLLNLVVRKMVVENIGVGRVENQFCRAAQTITKTGDWDCLRQILADFYIIDKQNFMKQLQNRPINPATLGFVRRSALQGTTTPDPRGHLHWVCPPKPAWSSFTVDDGHLLKTLGNTMLANVKPKQKNPPGSWGDFKDNVLNHADRDEIVVDKRNDDVWDAEAVKWAADEVADKAAQVWYPDE